MRYLGIDYGTKRLGIALSDEGGSFAFPHETIPNDATAIDRIASIVAHQHVAGIILGDTRSVGGAENRITPEADVFAEALASYVKIPVKRGWEAWSSIEASRFAPKGREHDDAAAAAIILQRFLDAGGKTA